MRRIRLFKQDPEMDGDDGYDYYWSNWLGPRDWNTGNYYRAEPCTPP